MRYSQMIDTVLSGNVQRAGYRTKVVSIAEALTITGTIQNLKDGKVKIIAEGNEKDLERFIHAEDTLNRFPACQKMWRSYNSFLPEVAYPLEGTILVTFFLERMLVGMKALTISCL